MRGLVFRIAVDASRDRGKGNRRATVRSRQFKRMSIAGGKQFWLAGAAAMPDRADCVDDVTCRKSIGPGDLRIAGLATAERAAFFEQLWSGRAVDGAVHAAAP